MSADFFAFDDPDFDAALTRAMRDEPLTQQLLDELIASDHVWPTLGTIAEQYEHLLKATGDEEQARRVLIAVAFAQGYRTGRFQAHFKP